MVIILRLNICICIYIAVAKYETEKSDKSTSYNQGLHLRLEPSHFLKLS